MKGNRHVREPIIPCNPPVYRSVRAVGDPGQLDGDLSKPFWQQGEWITDFHDIEGDSLPRPWKQTRAKILWTEEALYIGACLSDDQIWATVTQRDAVIFVDNDFEIFLAPQSTSHRYYELEMNALNTAWDLFMDRPQRDYAHRIIAWDIKGLETAVKIDGRLNDPTADNKSWSLEVKIPWYSLRECLPDQIQPPYLAPKPGEIWRADFSRVEWDVDVIDGKYVKRTRPDGKPLPEHNWLWAPTGVIDAHMPEMWSYLIFTEQGEDYPLPAEDEVKWVLRKLYYREHKHCCETGAYTADARALLGDEADTYGVKAWVTPSLFEATATFQGTEWHIDQDGYCWPGDRV